MTRPNNLPTRKRSKRSLRQNRPKDSSFNLTEMTPRELARAIRKMRAKPPITTEFERSLGETQSMGRVWYNSQKEHWLGWLSEYDGPGHYGRMNWDRSAKFVYNHINFPPMVLWLGEASGIPKRTVLEAKRNALSAHPSNAAQCAVIRRIIPWEAIEALLGKHSK
jgi:hypothetical protein